MSQESNPLEKACEIIKDRFYFLTFQEKGIRNLPQIHYFCTDDQFVYRNFHQDFGPLSLSCVTRYCRLVAKKIEAFKVNGKVLCHVTSQDSKKRTNAAFLVGCFCVLIAGKSPEETVRCLISQPAQPLFLPFRDVSLGPSLYNLGLLDCFRAMVKSSMLGLYDVNQFEVEETEHLEKIGNGDINWIIPRKFLAFPGPQNSISDNKEGIVRTPEFYLEYFLTTNISTVVRLNKETYSERVFLDAGLKHYDLYFPDGTVPSMDLVNKFFQISENAEGGIAVHCKAGLGRTGTMIGCYMMKNYTFTAAEAIAWIRITRPGSIIGMQQIFLNDLEKFLVRPENLEITKKNLMMHQQMVQQRFKGVEEQTILPHIPHSDYPHPSTTFEEAVRNTKSPKQFREPKAPVFFSDYKQPSKFYDQKQVEQAAKVQFPFQSHSRSPSPFHKMSKPELKFSFNDKIVKFHKTPIPQPSQPIRNSSRSKSVIPKPPPSPFIVEKEVELTRRVMGGQVPSDSEITQGDLLNQIKLRREKISNPLNAPKTFKQMYSSNQTQKFVQGPKGITFAQPSKQIKSFPQNQPHNLHQEVTYSQHYKNRLRNKDSMSIHQNKVNNNNIEILPQNFQHNPLVKNIYSDYSLINDPSLNDSTFYNYYTNTYNTIKSPQPVKFKKSHQLLTLKNFKNHSDDLVNIHKNQKMLKDHLNKSFHPFDPMNHPLITYQMSQQYKHQQQPLDEQAVIKLPELQKHKSTRRSTYIKYKNKDNKIVDVLKIHHTDDDRIDQMTENNNNHKNTHKTCLHDLIKEISKNSIVHKVSRNLSNHINPIEASFSHKKNSRDFEDMYVNRDIPKSFDDNLLEHVANLNNNKYLKCFPSNDLLPYNMKEICHRNISTPSINIRTSPSHDPLFHYKKHLLKHSSEKNLLNFIPKKCLSFRN